MVKITDDALLKAAAWLWEAGVDMGEFELVGEVTGSDLQMKKLEVFRRAIEIAVEISEGMESGT